MFVYGGEAKEEAGKMHHRSTTLVLHLLFCMSSLLVASAGPADVPLHDILGRNLTMDNVYYIRNYTVGSYSGGGLALYTAWPDYSCAKYVGFSSDGKDTGLAVRLVPYRGGSTVIYPGERFKLVLHSPPPCRSPELGLEYGFGTYVVTRGILAVESYFRVDVDELGRYTLLYCGFCASCNLCYTLGLAVDASPRFWSYGDDFNLFFQKKVVKEASQLHQSQ